MRKENRILAIVLLGMMMGAIDATIVILALPAITEDLHTNLSLSMWVIIVYLLILAVTTTQLGRLGDLFRKSRMFNIGFVIFIAGSALCGFAPDALFLVFSRSVQALGGAILEANSGAIIADTFAKDRRGRAYGYLSMSWSIGALIGIVMGGVLTTFVGWRFIFYINVPVGIIGLLLGMKYLEDKPATREKHDFTGMFVFAIALGLISLGLVDVTGSGATAKNLSLLGAGAFLIPVFLWWESRVKAPMIDPDIFRHRVLRSSILAAFFQSMGYLSLSFLMTMYLQGIRGLDPLDAAMVLLPGYALNAIMAPVMGGMLNRLGARIIATTGIGLMCFTVLIYMSLSIDSPLSVIVLASMISGLGSAMFWPANNNTIMAFTAADRHGSTTGVLRTMCNVGQLGSYMIAITAASVSVPRQTAFNIFMGTSNLVGSMSSQFLVGLDAAFGLSLVLLVISGVFSLTRGNASEPACVKVTS